MKTTLKTQTKIDLYTFETIFVWSETTKFWHLKTKVSGSKGLIEEKTHKVAMLFPLRKTMLAEHFAAIKTYFV